MSTRSVAKPLGVRAQAQPALRLPLEHYRFLAGAMLLVLIGITVLAPLGARPLPLRALYTPALGGGDMTFEQVFDYHAPAQTTVIGTPPRTALLRAAPESATFYNAIVSEILHAQSARANAASAPVRVRDDLLIDNPQRWNDMESSYGSSLNAAAGDYGVNGLAMVQALRSTQATGAARLALARDAEGAFNLVQATRPDIWYYRYNWALAQMLLGQFGTASAVLEDIPAEQATLAEVRFFKGLTALRSGDPAGAIAAWQIVSGSGVADWSGLASEGLSDAYAAEGDATSAANGYRQLLVARTVGVTAGLDWTLYEKLLRLEMQRGMANAMLDEIDTLRGAMPGDDKADLPRLLYDRGRILAVLGQPGAAVSSFDQGRALLPDEPAFHLALAQVLVANGNPRRGLTEAEAALRAAGADPNAADFAPVLAGLTGDDPAQRRGQQVLGARLAQVAAWEALGSDAQVQGMVSGLTSLAGQDAAHAGWYTYYAVLVAAAAGRGDVAQQQMGAALAQAGSPPAAPAVGATLDAVVSALTPAQAAAQAGDLLQRAGGTLAAPAAATEGAMATFYSHLAAALEAAGQSKAAGPLYRAAAAWEQTLRAVRGTAPIVATGAPVPVEYRAAEANYLLRSGDTRMAIARYRQLVAVAPAVVGAWSNIGVAYTQLGDSVRARRGFELAAFGAPGNALAQHDLGVLDYRAFNLLGGEAAYGAATVRGAPPARAWGNDLVAAQGPLTLPGAPPAGDFLLRLPALVALLLLLLHTLIPRPAPAAETPAHAAPQQSVLGRVAALLPDLGGRLSPPVSLLIAIAVAGVAWAWAAAANNPLIWLTLLVTGLLAAALALGGQELAQALAVRRERHRGVITQRLSPLGLLLAVLTAPFGLVYGWQIVTRATAAAGEPVADPDDTVPVRAEAASRTGKGVPARAGAALALFGGRPALVSWAALGPQARVALVGLLANVGLAVLCFLLYRLLGWPVWRLALLANLAVLAFTAVSEPQAEGWHLWRRAPLLWLFLFIGATAALTVFALGAV